MGLCKEDIDYLEHLNKHTCYVVVAWKYVREVLWDRGLLNEKEFDKTNTNIAFHDSSKVNMDEWIPYRNRFYVEWEDQSKVKEEFKAAVKRHKERNLHHYESLKDYKGDDWKCYVVELVCDYIAMGWEFNNFVLEYYESQKDKIDLPSEYKSYLETIMDILREPIMHSVEEPITPEFINDIMFKDTELKPRNNMDYTLHQKEGNKTNKD